MVSLSNHESSNYVFFSSEADKKMGKAILPLRET
jgi:hypothetical protein